MIFLRDFLKRSPLWLAALALILVFALYWNLLAARRYVSEARVVIEQVQLPGLIAGPDLPALLSGTPSAPPRDLLLLRDYLLSADMLLKLDGLLHLRAHYSGSRDPFSRLLYEKGPFEWFHSHYRSRVHVEYDYNAGVLVVQAQAYTPKMAQDVARAMLEEGERFMNDLARKLAHEQVAFAEREVAASARFMAQSRQVLVAYQNRHGLVSPTGTVGDVSAVVARLEVERSDLEARRGALEAYLAPSAPDLVQVRGQIQAVDKQLRAQRARLASTGGNALNQVAEEYDRLSLDANFRFAVYNTAVTALERARMDATRLLKKVSVLQQPPLPERSTEPGRLYYSLLYILGTLLLTGILQLLIAVVREHRD